MGHPVTECLRRSIRRNVHDIIYWPPETTTSELCLPPPRRVSTLLTPYRSSREAVGNQVTLVNMFEARPLHQWFPNISLVLGFDVNIKRLHAPLPPTYTNDLKHDLIISENNY